MRRVLTVSFGYPSDSAPARLLFTHEQARALARQGAHVEALDLRPPPDGGESQRNGIPIHRVFTPARFRGWRLPRALLRARTEIAERVRAGRFDLVLLSFLEHKYAPLWGALRASGARISFTAHGVDAMARWEPRPIRALKQALLLASGQTLAVSDATAALVRELVPPGGRVDVRVIENGVDREKLERARAEPAAVHRARLGWPEDTPVILSVGNLVPRKGFDRLVAASAALHARGRPHLWVIVGRGPEAADLGARARALGIRDQIRFETRVLSDAALAGAMAACDVFALASRTLTQPPAMEGFGVVYAEASYLGRPVVGGRSGGVPTAVVDEETGLLVDPEAPDAPRRFADAIERLLVEPDLAARLGAAGRARAQARFDWDLNARRVLEATARG